MGNIVEVIGVFKKYGRVKAVEDVSFKVREGEFYALLGPSGCGKTTILRILGGFIEQDSGNVLIDGKDMKGIPPNLRKTSMVFQDLALFPHMDVRSNIIYGLKKRRAGPDTIKDIFAIPKLLSIKLASFTFLFQVIQIQFRQLMKTEDVWFILVQVI